MRRAMTASAAQEQRGRGVRPPRPLAIPTVSFLGPRDDVGGNPRVVEAALMRAASPCSGQCLRTSSVLRCPTPPSVAVGVFDGVVKRTDVAPVWIPGMGDGALWDGYGRPARSSNAERPWRETCGTDRDPSVGSRLRSAMEDGVARRAPAADTLACHATAALGAAPTPPSGQTRRFARGRIGTRRTAQRSRGSYPTPWWWGVGSAAMAGTPSPRRGGREAVRCLRNQPEPCGGEASRCASVTIICGRRVREKKPRRRQRSTPRTRGSTPGHHSRSGAV